MCTPPPGTPKKKFSLKVVVTCKCEPKWVDNNKIVDKVTWGLVNEMPKDDPKKKS